MKFVYSGIRGRKMNLKEQVLIGIYVWWGKEPTLISGNNTN